MSKPSNSAGNTSRDVRKFLRSIGVKPTADNVERVQREVCRTESQHEAVMREAKERGVHGPRDAKGEVAPRIKERIAREQAERARRQK